jgi:hypothetical protein
MENKQIVVLAWTILNGHSVYETGKCEVIVKYTLLRDE